MDPLTEQLAEALRTIGERTRNYMDAENPEHRDDARYIYGVAAKVLAAYDAAKAKTIPPPPERV